MQARVAQVATTTPESMQSAASCAGLLDGRCANVLPGQANGRKGYLRF
jgi:hypothetical protein